MSSFIKIQSLKSSLFGGVRNPLLCLSRTLMTAAEKLAAVPDVDIDPEGTFKYVLIRVFGPEGPDGKEPSKLVVRGYKRAGFHSDVYDETMDRVKGLGVDTECTGGGRIQHDPSAKVIKVYGYSQGFGKADHSKTVEILKTAYPDYNITWSDEGY
ncbi:sex-regulated protein janus-A-like isoform X1 [Schistocerca cancellata]|uniref:sex-regulated protein janus-A-like isoform X1 n=1 Tax=Schistocerca cancellata TaxID=274614 RepID=UPI00211754E9|nr:sex-regulated protein janus-A-like isoform X1 [Schistocerca cancellata]